MRTQKEEQVIEEVVNFWERYGVCPEFEGKLRQVIRHNIYNNIDVEICLVKEQLQTWREESQEHQDLKGILKRLEQTKKGRIL